MSDSTFNEAAATRRFAKDAKLRSIWGVHTDDPRDAIYAGRLSDFLAAEREVEKRFAGLEEKVDVGQVVRE
jgi:hypothetical protein